MKLFHKLALAALVALPLISMGGCSLAVDRDDRGAFYSPGYYNDYGYRRGFYRARPVIVPERDHVVIER